MTGGGLITRHVTRLCESALLTVRRPIRCAMSTVRLAITLAGAAGLSWAMRRRSSLFRLCSASASAARQPAPVSPPTWPSEPVKAALCQLSVGVDKAANIASARVAIRDAAAQGAQLVVLPECWNGPYDTARFAELAEDLRGFTGAALSCAPSASALAQAAKDAQVVLVGGSLPERDGDKLFNTCLVFDAQGQLLAKHRKVHLFDVDIPGGISFRESDTLSPGDDATVVDTSVGRLGIGICFDIRFPELSLAMANRGAQVLVFPGAFNTVTGPLHWELLQRARAVDCQCFVLTCSPARSPGASYQAWGHSSAIGPFAEILATTDEQPGTVYATLDFQHIQDRRRAIPLASQRRGDIYSLLDRKKL